MALCTLLPAALAAGMLLVCAGLAAAQTTIAPTLYRLFLKTGPALVSWGEFSRIGDRVVFTLPLGDPYMPDKLQLVSLPAGVIDWDRTDRYADSVRYHRYAEVRGEADYKTLTEEMARALTAIAFSRDSVARLAAAEEARRRLVEWPMQHFGYRASAVRDLAATVEETIAGIRADAGGTHFEINLVATIEPPDTPLMEPPTVRGTIELAAEVARTSDLKSDRQSLQAAILDVLAAGRPAASAAWVSSTKKLVKDAVRAGDRDDRRYAALAARATRDAAAAAGRADVAGVERVLANIQKQDAAFGRLRPDEMRSLLAAVDNRLAAARQYRLELDRWKFRDETYRAYRAAMDNALGKFPAVVKTLEAIRGMSGPDFRDLNRAERKLAEIGVLLLPIMPPEELSPANEAMTSAVRLMQAAVKGRQTAMMSADLEAARNASAAAAGGLLLISSVRDDIRAFFAAPTVR